MLVHLTDDDGSSLAVMVAWVRMPKTASAQGLRRLADKYGTGCVTPVAGSPKPTGQHYASRRSGALVVIAEAEPVSGRPTDEALNAAADIAAQFPPPVGGKTAHQDRVPGVIVHAMEWVRILSFRNEGGYWTRRALSL
ncbi:hypothetical protein [Kibdelosporangium aridum]|uniref:hypothetical protein n=1 Tax=Kibdelosporangium aridum TaxID=2030 RepID=UPI0035E9C31E